MLGKSGKYIYEKFAAWMNVETESPVMGSASSDLSRAAPALRPGDVVLVEGRTRIGQLIKNVSQSSWTHSAIFIGRISDHKDSSNEALLREAWHGNEADYLLLEAEIGCGTVLTTIEKYQDFNIRICRPQSLTRVDTDNIIGHALKRLGQEYDVRQLIDLARFMYPLCLIPSRWRSSLFASRTQRSKKRTICSTLIADAFYSVDFPIRPIISKDESGNLKMNNLNARLCTPKDFDASPYFDIIKYPWIPLSNPGHYHQLPWISEAELTREKSNQLVGNETLIDQSSRYIKAMISESAFKRIYHSVQQLSRQVLAHSSLAIKSLRSLVGLSPN